MHEEMKWKKNEFEKMFVFYCNSFLLTQNSEFFSGIKKLFNLFLNTKKRP